MLLSSKRRIPGFHPDNAMAEFAKSTNGRLASIGNAPGLNPEVCREYPVSVRIVYLPLKIKVPVFQMVEKIGLNPIQ